MEFEFDPEKSKANREKHGISLEEATRLWSVPAVETEARTEDERRFLIIGPLGDKLYSCIFTRRGEKIRLISARRRRRKEVEIYDAYIRKEENQGE